MKELEDFIERKSKSILLEVDYREVKVCFNVDTTEELLKPLVAIKESLGFEVVRQLAEFKEWTIRTLGAITGPEIAGWLCKYYADRGYNVDFMSEDRKGNFAVLSRNCYEEERDHVSN